MEDFAGVWEILPVVFELTDEENELFELTQIHEITQSIFWGQGATIFIAGLQTLKGRTTAGRILNGVEAGLRGSDIELQVAEKVVKESTGESISKLIRRTGRGLLATGGLTVRAIKNKALWSKVIFLNVARGVGVGISGGAREAREGGDAAQVIGGALIGFATGVTFIDLVLPAGSAGAARRSPEGNLIIPGGLEGFLTEQSFVSVLAESIRLLVTGPIFPIGRF